MSMDPEMDRILRIQREEDAAERKRLEAVDDNLNKVTLNLGYQLSEEDRKLIHSGPLAIVRVHRYNSTGYPTFALMVTVESSIDE